MRDLLERIVKVMPLSEKSMQRQGLCGVWLTPKDIKVTDGHRAIVEKHSAKIKGLESGILIPRDALPTLKNILKATKFQDVELEYCTNKTLNITFLGGSFAITCVEAKMPAFESFMPKDHGKIKIGLNAEYLRELAKALDSRVGVVEIIADIPLDIDGKQVNVGKCLKPLVIKCGEKEAVLMPCRV